MSNKILDGRSLKGGGGPGGAGWAYQQLQLLRQAKYERKHGTPRKSLIALALERVKADEAAKKQAQAGAEEPKQ